MQTCPFLAGNAYQTQWFIATLDYFLPLPLWWMQQEYVGETLWYLNVIIFNPQCMCFKTKCMHIQHIYTHFACMCVYVFSPSSM